jgi:hypothetical protein
MKPIRQDKKSPSCDFWHRIKWGLIVYAGILAALLLWGRLA